MPRLGSGQQGRNDGLGQAEYAGQVHVDRELIGLVGHLPQRRATQHHAGHRDGGIEPAEFAHRGRNRAVERTLISHIGNHGKDEIRIRAALDQLLQILLGRQLVSERRVVRASVDRDDRPAVAREAPDGGRADAARSAGHDRDPG